MYLSQLFASLFYTILTVGFSTSAPQKLQGKVPFLTKGPFAIFFGGTDILTGLGDQVPLILMWMIRMILVCDTLRSDH